MKQSSQSNAIFRTLQWLKQPANLIYTGLVAAIMVAYVALHFQASYTFPFPWPDEAHFIWQANGFAEHFTLFAPELNPDRTIFWMPPGYLVILGIVIKLFGLSLVTARTFSLLLMLASIGILAAIIRQYRASLVSLLIAAPFALGAPFVAAGNIGRMEALLVLLVLCAFFLLQRGRLLFGLLLLALAPLVHPNGLYFLLTGIITAFLCAPRPLVWRRLAIGELIMAALVVCAWGGYVVYAGLHWPDFMHDMGFQFERKAVRNIKDAVIMPCSVPLFALVMLGSWYCWKKRLSVIFLLGIAAPAWWVAAAGIEMWYRVFFSIAFFLIAVISIGIAHHFATSGERKWRNRSLAGTVILVAGFVIGWNVMSSSFGEPLVFGQSKPWYRMTSSDIPYITTTDRIAVESRIDQISAPMNVPVVEFYPAGDAFFFTDYAGSRIHFSYPLFSTRQPDWFFVHYSSRFTPAFNRYFRELLAAASVNLDSLARYQITLTRDGEAWFLIPGRNNPESRLHR
ncbi:MAG: hypothetical protein WAU88_11480 [Candidatus Zixiibacteriota bacterium]